MKSWMCRLAIGGGMLIALVLGQSTTAGADHTEGPYYYEAKVCIRVGTDVRAPYKNGTCPVNDYYREQYVVASPYPEFGPYTMKVCFLPGTDIRAPYNKGPAAGNCPSEYFTAYVPALPLDGPCGPGPCDSSSRIGGDYELFCVKPATDIRAPYSNGSCPAGYNPVLVPVAYGKGDPSV